MFQAKKQIVGTWIQSPQIQDSLVKWTFTDDGIMSITAQDVPQDILYVHPSKANRISTTEYSFKKGLSRMRLFADGYFFDPEDSYFIVLKLTKKKMILFGVNQGIKGTLQFEFTRE